MNIRFRFTTKLLLVLMVLFGAILVPFVWRLERARKQKELVDDIFWRGGRAYDTYVPSFDGNSDFVKMKTAGYFGDIVAVSFNEGPQADTTRGFDFARLSILKKLKSIDLSRTHFDHIHVIPDLNKIEDLHLPETGIKSLKGIAKFRGLRSLNLNGTAVHDLSPVSGLTSLEAFSLADTAVADISPLVELENLLHLDISGTRVTNIDAVRNFRKLRVLKMTGLKEVDLSPLRDLRDLEAVHVSATISDVGEIKRIQSSSTAAMYIEWRQVGSAGSTNGTVGQ